MMKRAAGLLLTISLSACGGGGGSSATPAPAPAPAVFTPVTAGTCDKTTRTIPVGDYTITNNLWGMGVITDFTECITATSVGTVANNAAIQTGVTAKIDWSWPTVNFSVKAYPEIMYRPNGSPLAPIALSSIGGLTVNHDVTLAATGDYNLAYDMWVDATPATGQWPHKAEIMIKLLGTWTDSPVVDTITVNGATYDVCVNTGGSGTQQWKFLAFTSKTPMPKASIPVKPFVDYLVAKGYVSASDYLSTIEFGTELVQGTGSATVNAYSVTR